MQAANDQMTLHYRYDAFNRLVERSVGSAVVRYYYDDRWPLVAEYDGAGNLLAKYVYGPEIDEPVRMTRNGAEYYYHAAALGTVTEITDVSGNLVERYTYDVHGEPRMWDGSGSEISNSQIGNRLLFQGRDRDPATGLYNFRNRYYTPQWGRFVQADLIRHLAGENLFLSLDNSPIFKTDPLGLATISQSCLKNQRRAIESALNNLCKKAKRCAKCAKNQKASDGVSKVCDGDYTINCAHKDDERCKKGSCGYARIGGNEMFLCPAAFTSIGCGVALPGCTIFHESLHSGGLTHGNEEDQKVFNEFATCMNCF